MLSFMISFAPPAGEISACHLFPLFDVCLFSYFLLLYLTENDLSVLLMVIMKVCGENIYILLLRPGSDEDVFKRNIVTIA